jgi:hypothetical protein
VALDSLVGLARLLSASDPREAAAEQVVELLAFVLQHPASSQEAKGRATALLAELEGRLSPVAVVTAKERGQARDLQAIVEWWLAVQIAGGKSLFPDTCGSWRIPSCRGRISKKIARSLWPCLWP